MDDQGRTEPTAPRQIDPAVFLGEWVNTERAPHFLARVTIAGGGGTLRLRALGAGGPAPTDWGSAVADCLYASAPDGRVAAGFTATFRAPVPEIEVHANLSKGLLIVASFVRPTEGDAVFAREFFHKIPGTPG